MTGRARIPDGQRLARFDPIRQRGPWLAQRRAGVGASDIPALLDLSEYATALDVYVEKVVDAEPADRAETTGGSAGGPGGVRGSEAAWWGTIYEDTIAREWARRAGVRVQRVPTVRSRTDGWALASPDRAVLDCPVHAVCGLEVKTRSAWQAPEWRDGPPDDVAAQCQWQAFVTGWPAVHVAAVIGGNTPVFGHCVERDDELIGDLRVVVKEFWACVEARTPPDVDYDARLLATLQRMYPERAGQATVDPDVTRGLLAERRRHKAIHAASETTLAAIDARLVDQLAGAAIAIDPDGADLYSYKPQARKTFQAARFREAHPDLYEQYTERKPVKPTLRVLAKEYR